jgi:hypothetical protein
MKAAAWISQFLSKSIKASFPFTFLYIHLLCFRDMGRRGVFDEDG